MSAAASSSSSPPSFFSRVQCAGPAHGRRVLASAALRSTPDSTPHVVIRRGPTTQPVGAKADDATEDDLKGREAVQRNLPPFESTIAPEHFVLDDQLQANEGASLTEAVQVRPRVFKLDTLKTPDEYIAEFNALNGSNADRTKPVTFYDSNDWRDLKPLVLGWPGVGNKNEKDVRNVIRPWLYKTDDVVHKKPVPFALPPVHVWTSYSLSHYIEEIQHVIDKDALILQIPPNAFALAENHPFVNSRDERRYHGIPLDIEIVSATNTSPVGWRVELQVPDTESYVPGAWRTLYAQRDGVWQTHDKDGLEAPCESCLSSSSVYHTDPETGETQQIEIGRPVCTKKDGCGGRTCRERCAPPLRIEADARGAPPENHSVLYRIDPEDLHSAEGARWRTIADPAALLKELIDSHREEDGDAECIYIQLRTVDPDVTTAETNPEDVLDLAHYVAVAHAYEIREEAEAQKKEGQVTSATVVDENKNELTMARIPVSVFEAVYNKLVDKYHPSRIAVNMKTWRLRLTPDGGLKAAGLRRHMTNNKDDVQLSVQLNVTWMHYRGPQRLTKNEIETKLGAYTKQYDELSEIAGKMRDNDKTTAIALKKRAEAHTRAAPAPARAAAPQKSASAHPASIPSDDSSTADAEPRPTTAGRARVSYDDFIKHA